MRELFDETDTEKEEKEIPVTCLGIKFKSETQRRQHFRKILEQKLPDLRKMEGFPIGTDEDIINLSDPPYYTACPNPWLNDFIAEWEENKQELLKKKKRKKDFQALKPYAGDVSVGKNNPIYNAHSYHTKVPHPAIMRYILHYTQPGDIIFDGFAGTGMTGVAAQLCAKPDPDLKFQIEQEFKQQNLLKPKWGNRYAICGDLSPIASFIAYNYNIPVDIASSESEAKKILAKVEVECSWMYATKHIDGGEGKINYTVWSDVFICPSCSGEIVFWDTAVNKEEGRVEKEFLCPHCGAKQSKRTMDKAKITIFDKILAKSIQQIKTVPVLISYTYKNKRYQKKIDQNDLDLINKIEKMDIPYWYPINELPHGDKMGDPFSKLIMNVHQFYSKRNLWILASLWSKLNIRHKWIITNSISRNATKLNRFILNKYNPNGRINGPLSGTLYIPSEIVEQNIIELIRYKANFQTLPDFNSIIQTGSSSNISNIKNSSIDYIFTDPPFGSNIMYSELNYISESWLKIITNNRSEAIENKTQKKSIGGWQEIMTTIFIEYFRILKPNKWLTVEFSNTTAAVWNGIQHSLQRAGFIISNVAALNKKHGGIKSMTYPTAVKQDLVISCYKPTSELDKKFQTQKGEGNVWAFVDEHLDHLPVSLVKEEQTTTVVERTPQILYDRLITFFLMRDLPIPIDAADFQIKLKQKYYLLDGMIFTSEQAAAYEKQKQKLGIRNYQPDLFDVIYTEQDALYWLKERLKDDPQKYQDIQPDFRKANRATRKGEKEIELKILLEENFIEIPGGKWRVPDPDEAKDREILKTKALIKEFTNYLEILKNPKIKKIKDVRVEALRKGFKSLWEKKDFNTIVLVGEKIPQNLLMEDEKLLMFYDIAKERI